MGRNEHATCIVIAAVFTAVLLCPSAAQWNCTAAPSLVLSVMCEHLHDWDDQSRRDAAEEEEKRRALLPPAIPGLPEPSVVLDVDSGPIPDSPYICLDLGCLCPHMGGRPIAEGPNAQCTLANGQRLDRALRKEYRMLSDQERERFHSALAAIKRNGEYDRLASFHMQNLSASAHSGPAFLPWHREYLKCMEIVLRQVDPTVAMHYWDSTLDGALPSPNESIAFTAEFLGTIDEAGNVVTGPFAGWATLAGRPHVLRTVRAERSCLKEQHIQWFLNQTQIELILGFSTPKRACLLPTSWNLMEYTHGYVHYFVGGDMSNLSTSANDPIFFLHHSFMDHIWEMWRLSHQSRNEREYSYPQDQDIKPCASSQHFGSARMLPFVWMQNMDGLSNKYTDNMYTYAPRPSCAAGPDCGSKYLFCDRSHGEPRCAAKVRPGGNCKGFSKGEAVCISGQCENGLCVETQKSSKSEHPIKA